MGKKSSENYDRDMFLFCTRYYIRNLGPMPGIPTLPDIVECTIFFTNSTYPDLPISLPDDITDISGTEVELPTITGEYEDPYNYYTPLKWSIGNFGESIELIDEDLTANLEFTVVPKGDLYTVSFTNNTYPQFQVSLPESVLVLSGDSIVLPSVTGTFEDEDNTYTPQEWDIGGFGESYTPSSSVTTNLVWNVVPKTVYYTLSFTNTEYPEFDVPLPESIIAEEGSAVILPTVSGEYEDSTYTYTPDRWNVGNFGDTITLDADLSADLVWNVQPKIIEQALGGLISDTEDLYIPVFENTGLLTISGYAYSDGQLIGGDYPYGGMVEWDRPNSMFGIMDADSEYSLLPFDDSYTEIMNVTGYQYNYAEFVEDSSLDWLLNQHTLMKVWNPSDDLPKSYIVVNEQGDIGYSIGVEDVLIHQIQLNVPIVTFYFTNLGDQETENTVLRSGESIDLYDAEGNLVSDSKYDGVSALTFTQSNGNMIKASYNDFIVKGNDHLVMKPNTTYEAISVQVEDRSLIPLCGTLTSTSSTSMKVKELPCGILFKDDIIELDVGMRWYNNQWNNVTLDDWWYAGLLNQDDVDAITAFGLPPKTNDRVTSFGNLEFNPEYQYKILCIYDKVIDGHGADVLSYDLDNFYIENSNKYPSYNFNNQVLFEYITPLSSQARAYRLSIRKYNPPLERHIAYTSADKTPTTITNGSHVSLYDENGNTISVGTQNMRYDMLAYYASTSDTSHSYAEAGFVCIDFWSYSNIVLNNGNSSGITIQRIEYTVCKKNDAPPVTEKEVYYTNQGEAGKNTTVNASLTTLNVYDASGNKIPYDTTKTYTIISAKGTYLNNSTIQDWPSVLITNTSVINQSGFLCTYCGISSYGGFNVYISEMVIGIS